MSDALVARQFPVTGGFTATQLDNIGEVVGSGLELNARGALLQGSDVSVNVFANAAYLEEEITDLGGAPPLKTGGSYPRYRNFLVEGFTPAAFFGAETIPMDALGADQVPLNILDPVVVDGSPVCQIPTRQEALEYFADPIDPSSFKPLTVANSDFGTPIQGEVASNNCGSGLLNTYLGKPTPDWQGSFGFNMSFLGNWELAALAEFKAGNYYVQDLSNMFRRANAVIGRNTPEAARLNAIMQSPASTAEERLDAAIDWAYNVEGLAPMSGMNGVQRSAA